MAQQTVSITNTANDWLVTRTGASYGSLGTAVYSDSSVTTVFAPARRFDGANFEVSNALFKWDTSGLPDGATLSAASLLLDITGETSIDSRSLTADWFSWVGNNAPADHSINGDTAGFTAGTTAHSGTALSTFSTSGIYTIALTNVNTTNISLTGNTSLRLHVTGTQPTSENFLHIAGMEISSAQLLLTFTAPAPDIRQTASATSSGTGTSVTINKQSGTTAGDMMNATVAFQGGTGVTVTATGWTLVDRQDSTTAIGIATYSKTAGASESAETWTLSGSQSWDSACESYYVAYGQTPNLDTVSGQANASSTSIAAPGITTAKNDELLKYVGAINAGQAGGIAVASGMTELADVQTGTLFGGTVAAKTYYFLDAAATSGGDLMDMQDGGSAPATATMSTTGWTVGTNTAPNYADMDRAAIVARTASDATFGWKTTAPTSSVDSTRGNAGRIPVALNGTFASANWTYSWVPRLSSANTAQRVSLRFRLFRGTSATGSGATEVTAGAAEAGPMTAAASSASTTAYTVTVNPGALTLVNEYLFFVLCCRITTAGGATTSNILLTKDTNFQVATSTFTPTTDIALETAQEYRATAGAAGSRTATAGTNAAVNVASLMAFTAPPPAEIYRSGLLDYYY